MQDALCRQSDESLSDESFCLQVKLKSTQAETPAPQHLITNLGHKLKEDPLFEGTIRHLFRCQYNSCQCEPFNF